MFWKRHAYTACCIILLDACISGDTYKIVDKLVCLLFIYNATRKSTTIAISPWMKAKVQPVYASVLTLISDKPTAVGLILPKSVEQIVRINWWGTTNIKTSASFAASTTSGTATLKKTKLWLFIWDLKCSKVDLVKYIYFVATITSIRTSFTKIWNNSTSQSEILYHLAHGWLFICLAASSVWSYILHFQIIHSIGMEIRIHFNSGTKELSSTFNLRNA